MVATAPQPTQTASLESEGLNRDVGLLGLMWASEGSIIGSGWLFGALAALIAAGPSALLGWVLASIIVIILALVHAELGGLFPVTGGTSRFPHYAFGSLAGATFGWFAYIQAASVAPIEVLATIQYMSLFSWAHSWYKPPAPGALLGTLSGAGIGIAVALMFFFVCLNLIGIRWLASANTGITTWKVLVPIIVIIVLLFTHFHSGNFTAGGGFWAPGGTNVAAKAILKALPGAGIVFALLGFEQAVQLGGESANPQRDLPRAVIGSILIGAVIYILLQVVFIGALNPATIAHFHTWAKLADDGPLGQGPFYTRDLRGGPGLVGLDHPDRRRHLARRNGAHLPHLGLPSQLRPESERLRAQGPRVDELADQDPGDRRHRLRHRRLAVPAALPELGFARQHRHRGLGADVCRRAARPRGPAQEQAEPPALVPAARGEHLVAAGVHPGQLHRLLVRVGTRCRYSWWCWPIGYIIIAASSALHLNDKMPKMDWKASVWLFPYLIGMGLISYFGNFDSGATKGVFGGIGVFKNLLLGGNGDIGFWWDLLVLAGFSVAIYIMAIRSALPEADVDRYVADVYPPPIV